MNDDITVKIMKHLTFCDYVTEVTISMAKAAQMQNIELVHACADNRERLIAIVEKYQKEIEDFIKKLNPYNLAKEDLEIYRSWAQDVESWVRENNEIDEVITEALNHQKDQTVEEIASVFKNKQKFKGYNLNDVKK
jgi:hypothetical protein